MNKISIIIPIYNEAENIVELINHIKHSSSSQLIEEIIVVDGGSTDNSLDLVTGLDGVTILNADKGRAKQMNLGAKQAKADIRYFAILIQIEMVR